MPASAIRAGRAFVEIGTEDKGLEKGLKAAERKFRELGDKVASIGRGMAVAGAAVVAPIAAMGKLFASTGDVLAKASTRTGVAVEQLSALAYAAEQSGTDLEGLENGLRKMSKMITEAATGSATAADTLTALGLTVKDLDGLSPDQQFKLIADQISRIGDPTQKAAMAMEVFGKTGTTLIPLMADGARGIKDLEGAAERLGLTMGTDTAKAAEEFGDRMDDLGKVVKMAAFNVGAALAPMLRSATVAITEAAVQASAWIKEHRDAIAVVGLTVAKLGALTAAAGAVTFAVGKAVGAIGALAKAGAFLVANPFVALLAATAAAAAAVGYALARVADQTAQTSDAMAGLLQKGDRQRELDQLRIQRLDQLAHKEERNTAEMAEARDLIGKLAGRYGDLGVRIDETTGKIVGLTGAQAKLNQAMQSAALAQVDAELKERENNIRQLQNERRAVAGGNWHGMQIGQMGIFGPDQQKAVKDLQERIDVEKGYADALRKRRAALAGGDLSATTGAQDEAAALRGRLGDPLTTDQINARKQAIDAAKQLAQIEAEERKKQGDRFDQEIREAQEAGALKLKLIDQQLRGAKTQGELDALHMKQTRVIADTEARVRDLRKEQAADARKVAESYKDQVADLQRQLADLNGDRVASAKLDADAFRKRENARIDELKMSPGATKQARRLIEQIAKGMEAAPGQQAKDFLGDLQQQALQGAGDDAALRRFEAQRFREKTDEQIKGLGLTGPDLERAQSLRDQIADAMERAAQGSTTARGTFNSAAFQSLQGGGLDRITKATEKTAENTAKIAKQRYLQALFG